MKNGVLKLFFIFLTTTFSLMWIGEELSVLVENEKYSYYETAEKNDTENQTENKLKTQFIHPIYHFNLALVLLSSKQKQSTYYLFKTKEFSFENHTPPPEMV